MYDDMASMKKMRNIRQQTKFSHVNAASNCQPTASLASLLPTGLCSKLAQSTNPHRNERYQAQGTQGIFCVSPPLTTSDPVLSMIGPSTVRWRPAALSLSIVLAYHTTLLRSPVMFKSAAEVHRSAVHCPAWKC